MKICFIGAGSIGFTQKLIRDILKIPEFNDVTFSLNDISEQNLNLIKQLIEKDISFNKLGARVETHLNRKDAHDGSHPHLVHEFVSSIFEERQPWPNGNTTASWTAAGICAHESAMKGGERIEIPKFSFSSSNNSSPSFASKKS